MSSYLIRVQPEHIASLTATKELLIRIREAFGCDCQQLVDDLEEVLFLAQAEQPVGRRTGERWLQPADVRAHGCILDNRDAYEPDSPKAVGYIARMNELADLDRKRLKEER